MAGIHPTAIIDASAQIGAGVEIGPYCVIGADVTLGDECVLANHVTIAGPTTIGARNRFYPYTSIGQRSQDLKYAGEPTYLEIGNDNSFREFCTVNRGTAPGSKTVVGSHNNFLAYAHVAHDCTVGDHVIFSNNGTLAGHVIVEDHVVIGGLSGVHQFCRIGRHAIVGGCTKIVQDVAPYMIADGNPAELRGINQVGMERREFAAEEIRTLREAFRLLCRSNLNVKQACESIREQLPTNSHLEHLLSFIEASKRGIVR
ncbi:UDP-N-acetylglucosamine acyltransferase [Terrimicrobium sacchariphilum]|uniref:Acyl-[acyl-carrier-protein]--UDP-N-acetylglucosamine O-acyltransferase n=1 Tax=Terrimicrobium sacchariphilum TaxID=690879 RepID=A0A146GDB5_TERSA|nr:acyl-ACP--UDP-N-acetylglucosamine O-acyltransferase [Terrimicrobium sacchariphilum]GAT35153.1 UDP-N-acetylglucosamine acyltransferase [Terrimicrobium sacchariphilum]